jgi:uncharacterized protein YidB (DUF937 family)
MGLLDAVIGALGQSQGGGGGGGGGQAALLQAVIGMLTQGGGQGGQGGALGGLGGLVEQFTRNGMGDVVQSWVGSGQNMPVSADQITQVLGGDQLGQLARQLGMGHGDLAGQLSQMLPQVVDKLTPQGQLPHGNDLSALGDIGGLLSGFLKR